MRKAEGVLFTLSEGSGSSLVLEGKAHTLKPPAAMPIIRARCANGAVHNEGAEVPATLPLDPQAPMCACTGP